MSDHAGYAAAITIRDRVFNDAVLSAWHSGQIRHSFFKTIQENPAPTASVSFFFQSPQARFVPFDRVDGIFRITGWGTISLRVNPFPFPAESRNVQWQADLLITPTANSARSIVFLSAQKANYRLIGWQFDVLSGTPFSSAAEAYLNGNDFKGQLQTWLQDAIGDLLFPIVDFSFLGPFSGISFTTIDLQCVENAMIIGFNIDMGGFTTNGDKTALHDFARDNDVAVIVNPDAIKAMMPSANQMVQDQIDQYGATLERLDITCEEGRFRVSGRASMTGGAANFSLAALPRMTYGRPGAYIPMYKKTMIVKGRSWLALSFVAAEVSVDIDRSDWVILTETVGGVLTLGFLPFAVEAFLSEVVRNITGGIQSADLNTDGVTPRVRRFGDPPTRFKIEQFEIHTSGVFIGISSRLEAPGANLSGIRSIPRNFTGRGVRYEVQLPFEALESDPFLHVRWTVVDRDSGSVLLDQDGPAQNRRRLEFTPGALGSQVNRFAVVCRVFRVLGPFTTELLNETIHLEVGSFLPQGAFVRWHYYVKNPQIKYDGAAEQWLYTGDQVVERWSKFHRTDKPCKNANHRSRFIYFDEVLDDLPFPINDIAGNRYRLCDYCFFDGPASTIAKL
ncbi:MAG TPA: hypothetical protein VFA61_13395 [Candidatus Udaeobacter sp.]|nr:hypothetical protein [Candidatus Udaeobacter sp.]